MRKSAGIKMFEKPFKILLRVLLTVCAVWVGAFAEDPAPEPPPGTSAIDPSLGINSSGNYVNDFTGQVAFPINLGSIQNFGGLRFDINLNYYSGGVQEKYLELVKFSPNSWVGLGFNFGPPKITADFKGTSDIEDDEYYLFLDGTTPQEMARVNKKHYTVKTNPSILITRVMGSTAGAYSHWKIKLPNGNVFTFGNPSVEECVGGSSEARLCTFVNGASVGFGGNSERIADSWYITEISSPRKRFFIRFEYDRVEEGPITLPNGENTFVDRSMYLKEVFSEVASNAGHRIDQILFVRGSKLDNQFFDPTSINRFARFEKDRLEKIEFRHNGRLTGTYELGYFFSSQMLLQNINYLDPVYGKPRHYAQFEYVNRVEKEEDGEIIPADGRLKKYTDADGKSIEFEWDDLPNQPERVEQVFGEEVFGSSESNTVEFMKAGLDYFYVIIHESSTNDFHLYTFKKNSTYWEFWKKSPLFNFDYRIGKTVSFSLAPNEEYLAITSGDENDDACQRCCMDSKVYKLNDGVPEGTAIDLGLAGRLFCGRVEAFDKWLTVYQGKRVVFYWEDAAGNWDYKQTRVLDVTDPDWKWEKPIRFDIYSEDYHDEEYFVHRNQNELFIAINKNNSGRIDLMAKVEYDENLGKVVVPWGTKDEFDDPVIKVWERQGYSVLLRSMGALSKSYYVDVLFSDGTFERVGGVGGSTTDQFQVAGDLILVYHTTGGGQDVYRVNPMDHQVTREEDVLDVDIPEDKVIRFTPEYILLLDPKKLSGEGLYLSDLNGKYIKQTYDPQPSVKGILGNGGKLFAFNIVNPSGQNNNSSGLIRGSYFYRIVPAEGASVSYEAKAVESNLENLNKLALVGSGVALAYYRLDEFWYYFTNTLRFLHPFNPRFSPPHTVKTVTVRTKGASSSASDGTERKIEFDFSPIDSAGGNERPVKIALDSDIPNFAYTRKTSLEGRALIEFHRDELEDPLGEYEKHRHGMVKKQWFFPSAGPGSAPGGAEESAEAAGGSIAENSYIPQKFTEVQGKAVTTDEGPFNVTRQRYQKGKQHFFNRFTQHEGITKDYDPVNGTPRITIQKSGTDYLVTYRVFKHNLTSLSRFDLVSQVSRYHLNTNPCPSPLPPEGDPCPAVNEGSLVDPAQFQYRAVSSTYMEYDGDGQLLASYSWQPTKLGEDPQDGNTLNPKLPAPPTASPEDEFWIRQQRVVLRNDGSTGALAQNYGPTLVSTPATGDLEVKKSVFYGGKDGVVLGEVNGCNHTTNCALLTGEEEVSSGLGGEWSEGDATIAADLKHTGNNSIKVTNSNGPSIDLHLGADNENFLLREKGVSISFWMLVMGSATPAATVGYHDASSEVDSDQIITGFAPENRGKWVKFTHQIPYEDLISHGSVKFMVPEDFLRIKLGKDAGDASTDPIYFDDIRIHPTDAVAATMNYDVLGRVSSELDEENEPVFHRYDVYGRPVGSVDSRGLVYGSGARVGLGGKVEVPVLCKKNCDGDGVIVVGDQGFKRPPFDENEYCFTPLVELNDPFKGENYTLISDNGSIIVKEKQLCVTGPHKADLLGNITTSINIAGVGIFSEEFKVTVKGYVKVAEMDFSTEFSEGNSGYLEKVCQDNAGTPPCGFRTDFTEIYNESVVNNQNTDVIYRIYPEFQGMSAQRENLGLGYNRGWVDDIRKLEEPKELYRFLIKYGEFRFNYGRSWHATDWWRYVPHDHSLIMNPCFFEFNPPPNNPDPHYEFGYHNWPVDRGLSCYSVPGRNLPLYIEETADDVANGLPGDGGELDPSPNLLHFNIWGSTFDFYGGNVYEPAAFHKVNIKVEAYGYTP